MPSVDRRDLLLGAVALTATKACTEQARAEPAVMPADAKPSDPKPADPRPPDIKPSDLEPVTIPLWPNRPPGGTGPGGVEQVATGGSVANIVRPRMVMQRPIKPNGAAVLILGGGGYRRIGIAKESQPTADWLHDYGVTTFVLYYRLPNSGWPMLAPFQDAQRAMRLIRARAPDLGLDPSQIGIIGYSAGGHCAGMVSVQPDANWYAPVDALDDQSARPDYAGLIYPVLTMMPPNRTRMSTLTLLGADPSLELSATWSVDQQVTATRRRPSWHRPPTTRSHRWRTASSCSARCARRTCRSRCTCSAPAVTASTSGSPAPRTMPGRASTRPGPASRRCEGQAQRARGRAPGLKCHLRSRGGIARTH